MINPNEIRAQAKAMRFATLAFLTIILTVISLFLPQPARRIVQLIALAIILLDVAGLLVFRLRKQAGDE